MPSQASAIEGGLQAIKTPNELAIVLGISPTRLRYLLYRLSPAERYRVFELRKRSGGTRTIRAPIRPLKQVQRKIVDLLAPYYKPKNCVFGYVRERSHKLNAEVHAQSRWVLRVDLKDFFPSIHFGRVRG